MFTVKPRSMPRTVLLALALVGLVCSMLAATARPAAADPSDCSVKVFFGLHGIGEGPSGSVPAEAPELSGFDYYQNQISGEVLNDPVPYTTVAFSALDLIPGSPDLALDVLNAVTAVSDGVSALSSAVNGWVAGCPLSELNIALVGYSMGAWIINDWLVHNQASWKYIKAVVLYGDPCWTDGADRGMVRAAESAIPAIGAIDGCMPPGTYPYPATSHPFLTQSWCVGGDPVCGAGFADNTAAMGASALVCVAEAVTGPPFPHCPHFWYRVGQPAASTLQDGAQFVVTQLNATP